MRATARMPRRSRNRSGEKAIRTAPVLAEHVQKRQLEKSVSWTGRERLRCLRYRLRLTVAEMNYAARRIVELQMRLPLRQPFSPVRVRAHDMDLPDHEEAAGQEGQETEMEISEERLMSAQMHAETGQPGPSRETAGTRRQPQAPCGARRRAGRTGGVPALAALVAIAALLTGCGSGGAPGTFSSQHYGYTAALPAGWAGRQAGQQWNGTGSPGFEDGDVDLFTGPNSIIAMAYATASSQSLAAYTSATVQAAAAAHQCPAVPQTDQAITIGGAPARLLSVHCQGLPIQTAITTHAGKAIVFVSQEPSGTRADRVAFRKFLAGIRFQR